MTQMKLVASLEKWMLNVVIKAIGQYSLELRHVDLGYVDGCSPGKTGCSEPSFVRRSGYYYVTNRLLGYKLGGENVG